MLKPLLRWPVMGLAIAMMFGCHHKNQNTYTDAFGIERRTEPAMETHRNTQAEQAVMQASDRFHSALTPMFHGDMTQMDAVWSHSPDVSLMSPYGDRQLGWEQVQAELRNEANRNMSGRVYLDRPIVRVDHSGDLAWVTGFERGENFTVNGRPMNIELRATSIYRKEHGQWKLVHHHTDASPEMMQPRAAER